MEMIGESRGIRNKYFVVFNYWKAGNTYGVASTVIERDLPVSGWDDILGITDIILSRNPDMENVVIINWRRFEDPE
jgi:hypothetical protein